MTDADLIKQSACYDCDAHERVQDEPPFYVCALSGTDDFACPRALAVQHFEDKARAFAAHCADKCRHVPEDIRAAFTAEIADSLDNALFAFGARLDVVAFLRMAGVRPEQEVRP
jgi:hypothetical protein